MTEPTTFLAVFKAIEDAVRERLTNIPGMAEADAHKYVLEVADVAWKLSGEGPSEQNTTVINNAAPPVGNQTRHVQERDKESVRANIELRQDFQRLVSEFRSLSTNRDDVQWGVEQAVEVARFHEERADAAEAQAASMSRLIDNVERCTSDRVKSTYGDRAAAHNLTLVDIIYYRRHAGLVR